MSFAIVCALKIQSNKKGPKPRMVSPEWLQKAGRNENNLTETDKSTQEETLESKLSSGPF